MLGVDAEGTGIVHLGAGAFARAHLWWATARAVDAAGGPWGVLAVGQRSPRVVSALRARGWRYSVRLLGATEDTTEEVAVVRDGLVAAQEPDRLRAVAAHADTHLVLVTATEAAYRPGSVLVQQVLQTASDRAARGLPPLSVLVCDNVAAGGRLLRSLALQAAVQQGRGALTSELEAWSWPTSVVDRVVPAVPVDQEPDVLADPVFRWVVEDDFAGPRPAWELAGVQVVADAEPWQQAKLVLVNAPHSLVASLGLLLGHDTVAGAMADPVVHGAVRGVLRRELVPTVPPAPGLDAGADAEATVQRFSRQVVPHALTQVGAEGSSKLPQRFGRLVGSGVSPAWAAALWVTCVVQGLVVDRQAAALRSAAPEDRAATATAVLGWSDPGTTEQLRECLRALGSGSPAEVRDAVSSALHD